MPTPFATLQARGNAAVLMRLADARASVGGGEPFPVLFEADYLGALGVGSDGPAFTCDAAVVVALTQGVEVLVDRVGTSGAMSPDSVAYRVANPEPDGAGLALVRLRKV